MSRCRLLIVVSFAVLFLALVGATAAAHEGGTLGEASFEQAPCEPDHVDHLGPACEIGDGFYQVFLEDGTTLTTHGPDPALPDADVGFFDGAEERDPYCTTRHHMHVLYGHPASSANRIDALEEDLRDIIKRMNAVLNADGLASGGIPTDYKVNCNENGEIRIDTFEGPETQGADYTTDFAQIVDAARSQGFQETGVNYLIFYDDGGGSVCGVGNMQQDDRLSEDNANLKGPNYGVAYEGCWEGRTPMHENAHNMGAVQRLAPLSDGAGHCLEGYDVMCYTSNLVGPILCSDRVYFDCNHHTYFHTDPDPDAWLANHWNLGSHYNHFLAFNEPQPPTAAFTYACTDARCELNASTSQDPDGDIQAYRWDLGDGNTTTGETTHHTYDAPGTYTVTLTVTGTDDGTATQQQALTVQTDGSPTVTARFTHACQLAPCTFNASQSQAHDSEIASYEWDFGDGNTATGETVTHDYAERGLYTVVLTVTTERGHVDQSAKDVIVRAAASDDGSDEEILAHEEAEDDDHGTDASWDAVPLGPVGLLTALVAASALVRRDAF